jgi:hypothetical protein
MRRVLIVVGVWIGVTAGATVMAWAAVSFVASGVTDRPAAALPSGAVVAALRAGAVAHTQPSVPPTTVAAKPNATGSTVARPAAAPVLTAPGPTASAKGGTVPVSPTTAPRSDAGRPTSGDGGGPSAGGGAPPVPPPGADATQTFSTPGGVATAMCHGSSISLTSASPTDGYALNVAKSGPEEIDVRFEGKDRAYEVRAKCVNGQPTSLGGSGDD